MRATRTISLLWLLVALLWAPPRANASNPIDDMINAITDPASVYRDFVLEGSQYRATTRRKAKALARMERAFESIDDPVKVEKIRTAARVFFGGFGGEQTRVYLPLHTETLLAELLADYAARPTGRLTITHRARGTGSTDRINHVRLHLEAEDRTEITVNLENALAGDIARKPVTTIKVAQPGKTNTIRFSQRPIGKVVDRAQYQFDVFFKEESAEGKRREKFVVNYTGSLAQKRGIAGRFSPTAIPGPQLKKFRHLRDRNRTARAVNSKVRALVPTGKQSSKSSARTAR